jgi:hypothetical protein
MDWTKAHGCDRVLLHASDMGRPLYASLGFEDSNEMRWFPFDADHSADGE